MKPLIQSPRILHRQILKQNQFFEKDFPHNLGLVLPSQSPAATLQT